MRWLFPLLCIGCLALRGQWRFEQAPCGGPVCVAPIRHETMPVADIYNQSDRAFDVLLVCIASQDPRWPRVYPAFTLPAHTAQTYLLDDDAVDPCVVKWAPAGSLSD